MKKLSILMHAGIGDAWGACFEYAPRKVIEENINNWNYFKHHKYNLGEGRYTDDLQMHLAVAEVLISDRSNTKKAFTAAFVNAFQRDPREGYAGRFYEFLQTVSDPQDFSNRIINNSEKSGGAMRAACIGVLKDETEVIEVSRTQASVTHNTEKGMGAAVAASLMLHALLYRNVNKERLSEYLNDLVPVTNWSDLPKEKIGHLGVDSVKAALRAVKTGNTCQDILQSIIVCGGDTDTAATIAMAVASCSDEIDQNLPQSLYDKFESGLYGRSYIEEMDRKLTNFAEHQAL